MLDFSICIFTNLMRMYLVYRLMRIFWGRREESRGKELLAYLAFYVINTGLYLTFHLVWVNIVCNLLGIGLLTRLYTKSVKMTLFVTGFIYTISMGCDTIAGLSFIKYGNGKAVSPKYSLITVVLILLCELLAERIIGEKRGAGFKMEQAQSHVLLALPLCSLVLRCLLIYTGIRTGLGVVMISVGPLVMSLLIIHLYDTALERLSRQYENEKLRQEMKSYVNQMRTVLQGEEKLRALRHDMRHHMNELRLLAAANESEEIQRYMEQMEHFIENPDELVDSGNTEIDSVLNYMLRQAKAKLQEVNIKIQLPKELEHSFDINVILSNLLENAIEAASQTEEKRLDVNIQFRQGVLRIEIENSFQGELRRDCQKLLTTKKEKECHGIGLENVKRIVEKYHGLVELSAQEHTFFARAVLYMPEN